MPDESNTYREHVVYWSKDLRRSFDYLEADIDTERIAFYGVSWGGRMAPVMLAVEDRFKAASFWRHVLTKSITSRPERQHGHDHALPPLLVP